LLAVALKEFDFVIVDLPHILDGITIKALDRSDNIFIITQPIMTYLRAVTNVIHLFNRLDYTPEKIRVVLNRMDEVGVLSVAKVEDSIQKKISATIPNDFKNGVESVNLGLPILKIAPTSPICMALRGIAEDLTGMIPVQKAKTSWFKSILNQ
jgi:pilus assembly protein CpaE